MKGVFIHNGVEYCLEVTGDEFSQGDPISCTISIKNHSPKTQSHKGLLLELAFANLGKLKKKEDCIIDVRNSLPPGDPFELAPQSEKVASTTFHLDSNCPISDKNQSLCFLYGDTDSSVPKGHLVLVVKPHMFIQQILGVFESTFQFVRKGEKSSEGWVLAKFKPSTARKLSFVDEVTAAFRYEDTDLILKYVFKVNKFDTTLNTMGIKKEKKELEQRLRKDQYLLTKDHINDQAIESLIEEALDFVSMGL